jgi:long-chain acyl-CoA synthetase
VSAASLAGSVKKPQTRQIDDARDDAIGNFERNEIRPQRIPAHIIARAVDRVNDPFPAAARLRACAFLAEKPVLREGVREHPRDQLLAFTIRLSDGGIVGLSLRDDSRLVAPREFRGLPGSLDGNLEFAQPLAHLFRLPHQPSTIAFMGTRTVYSVLEEAARSYGDATALHQPLGKRKYQSCSWIEYKRAAEEIACGLRRVGIHPGDVVALYSETRAEFYLADLGILSNGSIAAALYTAYPLPQQIGNLRAMGAKAVFVEHPKSLEALIAVAEDSQAPLRWILLTGEAENAMTLEQLRAEGRLALTENPNAFDEIRAGVRPEDAAVLYLTSGATGEPKMALVTHAALVANIDMGPAALPLSPADCTIAFLPSAHIAQRVVLELLPIRMGFSVWFSESLSKLPEELRSIRPTFLLAPPRVWERVFASINVELKKQSAAVRKMFHGAVGLGAEVSRLREEGKRVPKSMRALLKLADRLLFSKVRARLGGRIRIAASGAAPLGKDLARFYAAIGMPLIEGYGLTEGGVVCFNPLARPKSGSIGVKLPGVELRLAEDGELLVKSPSLFSGYYNDPASTAAVLRDGWLSTGDIAELDSDGYVYITGRKKELIVSSNGKKIFPARIEGLFKTEPLINHVVLIGDRLPYVTALVTVNAAEVAGPVVSEVSKAVARVNRQLAPFEQIRKFRVIEREFTVEAGELTPTMKIRRNRVLENHRELVSELYMGKEESQ